jgi:hypothetical protein
VTHIIFGRVLGRCDAAMAKVADDCLVMIIADLEHARGDAKS